MVSVMRFILLGREMLQEAESEQWGGGGKRLNAPPLEVQPAPVYPMYLQLRVTLSMVFALKRVRLSHLLHAGQYCRKEMFC